MPVAFCSLAEHLAMLGYLDKAIWGLLQLQWTSDLRLTIKVTVCACVMSAQSCLEISHGWNSNKRIWQPNGNPVRQCSSDVRCAFPLKLNKKGSQTCKANQIALRLSDVRPWPSQSLVVSHFAFCLNIHPRLTVGIPCMAIPLHPGAIFWCFLQSSIPLSGESEGPHW